MCEFRTMGAKKYVYREAPDSKLICTIAGVSKQKGGEELEAHGGITAFHEGFTFTEAGGLEAIYNDIPTYIATEYEAEGQTCKITANVCLRPSTYTLGLTADYKRLLTEIRYEYE